MEEPKKAKLPSPEERMELILLGLARKVPIQELCRQAGVSRELFYRWLKRVRKAGLKALEAEEPGPKEKLEPEPQEQMRKLRERIAALEAQERSLRKERDHLEEVVDTARQMIRRNAWGPLETRLKKKGMRTPRRANYASKNGRNPEQKGPRSEDSACAGGSIGAPSGDGEQGSPAKGGESASG